MSYTFDLATQRDDAEIRRLLATSAMPGRIAVTFEREPDYFAGCDTMGHFWQVLVGRHHPDGELAGVLCRAVQPRFVNGEVQEIGYLGQLRIAQGHQGRWVLLHGLEAMRQLHGDRRVRLYLLAISAENRIARGILVDHPRPSFPAMAEVAHLYTMGIVLRQSWSRPNRAGKRLAAGLQVDRGSRTVLGEIISFLRGEGPRRQFYPAYEECDLGGSLTRGFEVDDMIVARRAGLIVGVVGLWDQSAYKQTVVQSYDRSLRPIRPCYNLAARAVGMQPLPRPGEHIRSAYASFLCVAGDDPLVFAALLDRLCRLASERRFAYLMLGLAERDPLLATARRYPHIAYRSTLYAAFWEDGQEDYVRLDGRVPYVEIAAL